MVPRFFHQYAMHRTAITSWKLPVEREAGGEIDRGGYANPLQNPC